MQRNVLDFPVRAVAGELRALGGAGMSELVITKRLFVYEFVIRTRASVQENAEKLESYLSHLERPKGFFLSDPRLTGHVHGSTFSLQPYDGPLWGTEIPEIEGAFIPNEQGSDVVVRVGSSTATKWLWLPVVCVVGVSLYTASLGWEALVLTLFVGLVAFGLLTMPVLVHGSTAASTLKQVFPR